jgi:hypothetical protein
MEEANKDMLRFSEWMISKVKSVHYADNAGMSRAYEKVHENSLRLTIKSK